MVQLKEFAGGRRAAVLGLIAVTGTTIAVGGVAAAGQGRPSASESPGPPPAPRTGAAVRAPAPRKAAEPRLGRIPTITERGQRLAMPIDAYQTSASDLKLIDQAASLKARDCMRSLGYRSWSANTVTTSRPSDYKELDLLDYLDPASVRKVGYPHTLDDKQSPAVTSNVAPGPKPGKEALRAFVGDAPRTTDGRAIPPGGCLRQGDSAVEGAAQALPMDPRLLDVQAKFSALRDSRMRNAFAAWSACMANDGLRYPDPLSAQNDGRWGRRPASTPASDEEKRVAYADSQCEQKINLVGTYKALEMAYQEQSINANRAKIEGALKIFRKWVKTAREIASKG